jgi:hypothetical protein
MSDSGVILTNCLRYSRPFPVSLPVHVPVYRTDTDIKTSSRPISPQLLELIFKRKEKEV